MFRPREHLGGAESILPITVYTAVRRRTCSSFPEGAYHAKGFNPVKILVANNHVRTIRGGVGEAKTGINHAAGIHAGSTAKEEGYAEILWLDGVERRYIEELSAMNIFFVLGYQDSEIQLVTPELNGSILPGITRDSVLALSRAHVNG